METALDVLSRAATMVQDNANETRLTTKELPTADWRRKRRARTGEYPHGIGNKSPLNASPPCSPGATIPTAVAHRVQFYSHVPATRYPPMHYAQTMPPHHTAIHAAATPAAIMLPAQTSVAAAVAAGATVSSITSPSPSPTSSNSSLSQTSLLMRLPIEQQTSGTYAPQAHRSSQAVATASEMHDDEQNLDRPLDMTVSSALLKQQRESPPPPYREPLPGSCYMATLARPSVITQAPPKRKGDIASEGNEEEIKSIVIQTQLDDKQSTASMCETVIDEHFRRSLGADYLALFANKKTITTNNDNNKYYEQPAPLQLTTKSTPPSSPVVTPEPMQQQQHVVEQTSLPLTRENEQPLTLVMTKITTTTTTTTTTTNTDAANTEITNTSTDVNINETKRYGKHKIAYMQQKSNQNYYQQQKQQQAEANEITSRITTTTTTDDALSLIQPRNVAVLSPQLQLQVGVDGKKKLTNNIVVKVEPQASICDIVAEENLNKNTAAALPLMRTNKSNVNSSNNNTINTVPASAVTLNVKAASPTSNATISEEASVDDHFAKALGDKWKELQTNKNLLK